MPPLPHPNEVSCCGVLFLFLKLLISTTNIPGLFRSQLLLHDQPSPCLFLDKSRVFPFHCPYVEIGSDSICIRHAWIFSFPPGPVFQSKILSFPDSTPLAPLLIFPSPCCCLIFSCSESGRKPFSAPIHPSAPDNWFHLHPNEGILESMINPMSAQASPFPPPQLI